MRTKVVKIADKEIIVAEKRIKDFKKLSNDLSVSFKEIINIDVEGKTTDDVITGVLNILVDKLTIIFPELTNDDIDAISKVENVEHVDGSFETDGQIEIENKEVIAKVMSLNDFNTPVLIEGSLPSAQNECAVEPSFLLANNKKIGDTIELNIEDSQNDDGEDVP